MQDNLEDRKFSNFDKLVPLLIDPERLGTPAWRYTMESCKNKFSSAQKERIAVGVCENVSKSNAMLSGENTFQENILPEIKKYFPFIESKYDKVKSLKFIIDAEGSDDNKEELQDFIKEQGLPGREGHLLAHLDKKARGVNTSLLDLPREEGIVSLGHMKLNTGGHLRQGYENWALSSSAEESGSMPSLDDTTVNLGKIYLAKKMQKDGNHKDAVELYREALAAPLIRENAYMSARVHARMGLSLGFMGEDENAIKSLQQAFDEPEFKNTHPDFWYSIGERLAILQWRKSGISQAKKTFDTIIKDGRIISPAITRLPSEASFGKRMQMEMVDFIGEYKHGIEKDTREVVLYALAESNYEEVQRKVVDVSTNRESDFSDDLHNASFIALSTSRHEAVQADVARAMLGHPGLLEEGARRVVLDNLAKEAHTGKRKHADIETPEGEKNIGLSLMRKAKTFQEKGKHEEAMPFLRLALSREDLRSDEPTCDKAKALLCSSLAHMGKERESFHLLTEGLQMEDANRRKNMVAKKTQTDHSPELEMKGENVPDYWEEAGVGLAFYQWETRGIGAANETFDLLANYDKKIPASFLSRLFPEEGAERASGLDVAAQRQEMQLNACSLARVAPRLFHDDAYAGLLLKLGSSPYEKAQLAALTIVKEDLKGLVMKEGSSRAASLDAGEEEILIGLFPSEFVDCMKARKGERLNEEIPFYKPFPWEPRPEIADFSDGVFINSAKSPHGNVRKFVEKNIDLVTNQSRTSVVEILALEGRGDGKGARGARSL